MASNNADEHEELVQIIREKFVIASPAVEELDSNKEHMLNKSEKFNTWAKPIQEIYQLKNGEKRTVDLVYNTKKGDIDAKHIQKYKTALCVNHKNGFCPYGGDCKYAHGKEELDRYRTYFDVARDYINAAKKKSLDEHIEPCRNQQCPIKLLLLLRKTVLCEYYLEDRCNRTSDTCTYAHGEQEVVPLPKYELCIKFGQGSCRLKSSQCVYAHGKHEKRRKGEKADVIKIDSKTLCGNCQTLYDQISDKDFIRRYITEEAE